MDLISIIIIIAIISKVIKKGQETQEKAGRNKSNSSNQTAGQRQSRQYSSGQSEEWKRLARENIEKAKKRATEKLREVERAHTGRMETQNTSVLQRAKANTDENKVDVTLRTMETEHNHSERVSPAKHHHPEDVISDNMLGTIEDLMVKGYDGNLCFERDFVGEAMDMISRFTVPSDVPDFSKDDVA